ncbi:hypothetical protein Tco_1477652 [Tanacetum coccineum]
MITDNAYKIELPGHYNVSATFNVADLSPYKGDSADEPDSGSSLFQEGGDDADAVNERVNMTNTVVSAAFEKPMNLLNKRISRLENFGLVLVLVWLVFLSICITMVTSGFATCALTKAVPGPRFQHLLKLLHIGEG